MKTFIILGLIFTAVNSSFLRELTATEVTVSSVTFGSECSADGATVTVTVALKDTPDVSSAQFKGLLSSGIEENDLTLAAIAGASSGSIQWTLATADANTGVYKLTSITQSTDGEATFMVTIPDTITSALTISTAAAHDETQTGTQEIEEGNAFEVKFTGTLAKVPMIYSSSTSTTPIADCSADKTEATKILCKPTSEEMKADTEYTIHYKNACEADLVATAVKVKFTPKEGSAFITFGKVALLAIALLF